MADIQEEIKTFEGMQAELEANHTGQWVLIHDRQLVSLHDSFEDAASHGVRRFGAGPYLIRQVGAPPISLPASVMYHRTDAQR